MKKHTTESFIEKAKSVHGETFNYKNVDYKNCGAKVEIICQKHGSFFQRPDHHWAGHGCILCRNENTGLLLRGSFEDFLKKAKDIHGEKYSYNQDSFRGMRKKTKITCSAHGEFYQTAIEHVAGSGCKLCSFQATSERQKIDRETLLKRLHSINNRKYEFNISNYETLHSTIEVFCLEHQIKFKARVGNFLNGKIGCPCCKTKSQGERKLAKILTDHRISFEHEKTFSNLVAETGQKLRFDFYLPHSNVLIEYDGVQHFEPVARFGGEFGFAKTQKCDEMKNNFCQQNNIQLIRIRYDEDISSVLRNNGILR